MAAATTLHVAPRLTPTLRKLRTPGVSDVLRQYLSA